MRVRLAVWTLLGIGILVSGRPSAFSQNAEVDWGARISNGIGDAFGTPLPNGSGDLLWVGHFNLTNAQIVANATNKAFLLSNFVIYAASTPGAGGPINGGGSNDDGYWRANSQSSTANAGTGASGTLTNSNIQNSAID